MASTFSKPRLARFHALLARHVERDDVPGLVAAVCRRGEVHVETIGTKTLGGDDTVTRDTIFRIASITKPITATAAMLLVEDGTLRLDDPVAELLPELANPRVLRNLDSAIDDTVPAHRPITTRDVLTFTMGSGMPMAMPGTYPVQEAMDALAFSSAPPNPDGPPAADEWLRRFASLPLMHQPGEQWMYHTSADVLGVLIARASGQSFEDVLQERVFGPLGMTDTAFFTPPEKLDRFASAYSPDPESGKLRLFDAPDGQWSRPPAFASGGGGLVGTADDLLAFGGMLLAHGVHGRTRLLARPTVEAMTSDQLTAAQKAASTFVPGFFEQQSWGYGMTVLTRRDGTTRSPGTYGWDGGLGTVWYNDPREDLVAVLLTQRAFTSPVPPAVCTDFWTGVYQAIDD
jgi:CubicO group peptidase (beta-lactamase class C family)